MSWRIAIAAGALLVSAASHPAAQGRGGAPAQAPTPKAAAPIDLTGYWVSVVTEDWRWRMVVPPKGDYTSLPLNPEGRRVADSWDPATVSAQGCKPFGAAAIMRVPGRLHITWDGETTLKIDTDAGRQTRLIRFDKTLKASGDRTWQGLSIGEWEVAAAGRGAAGRGAGPPPAAVNGTLKVVTSHIRAGYLRRNGVPFSENTAMTEYFDRHGAYGSEWFTVTTIVEDPLYLTQPFITSTHFKREADGAKLAPVACE